MGCAGPTRVKFSGDWSNACRNMGIFQFFKMAAAAKLTFGNIKILMDTRVKGSNCIKLSNFLTTGGTVAEIWQFFSIFQYGGRRHRRFLNFRNLTIDTVKKLKTRHRAKFRGDRLNRCGYWDFSIFSIRYGDFSIFPRG